MGRRGPLPSRGEPASVTVVTRPQPPGDLPPPPPPGLLAATRTTWESFWTSAAAQWVDRGAHMARLERWIRDVDQWHRIQRDLRPARAVAPRVPTPPTGLTGTALSVWTAAAETYPLADPVLLRAYADAVARYEQAAGMLAQTSPLISSASNGLVRNPLHQVVLENTAQLTRLLRELDEQQRAREVYDAERPWLARGSTGQVTRHPSADLLDQLDARIHRAEVEFGMTPYAGVRLGLAGVQGALTAEQLSRLIVERAKREPDQTDADWAEGFRPA